MLSKIQISFDKSNEDISFRAGSVFHGALMQLLDSEYANILHQNTIKPYSQNVIYTSDKILWNVNTLTEEAKEKITDVLMGEKFNSLHLSHKDITLNVCDKKIISQTTYDELFKKIYIDNQYENYSSYKFFTPTAFKSNGRYINMPNVHLIFNSIISKYDACASSIELKDDSLMNEIDEYVNITNYNLRSSYYALEGVKIPSFLGEITVASYRNEQFRKLISMMLEFSTYSGIGIKTALGMGAVIKVIKG